MVQEWSAVIDGDISGTQIQFDMAFSNIDDMAPDGLTGETEVAIELRVE